MVFSSITFLFFFLPITLLVYFCSSNLKNVALLSISLLFYAWGEGLYVLLMLASIVANYVTGLLIGNAETTRRAKIFLALSLLFNFSLLCFFKYGMFLVENLNHILETVYISQIKLTNIHLPIGISFFTFQAVSYNFDVYRKQTAPQRSLVNLGLYISLFPQLIAGPIVRYHNIAKSLTNRVVTAYDFSSGIKRFLFGLSKKVLLANPLGSVADKIFDLPATELTTPLAWLGACCYTLQIYYDFSGYSDMAIGLGRMFGFRFLENFNYPYIAKSIRDFWRRWHISLSSWFRDYLYIPLGGNRKGRLRTYINLLVVFFLCGLWHGASWTFICWGLYHGAFLIIERTTIGNLVEKTWLPLRHITTLLIIIVGWVIFRSDTLSGAIDFIKIMFYLTEGAERELVGIYLDEKLITELVFAILFTAPLTLLFRENVKRVIANFSDPKVQSLLTSCLATVQLVLLGSLTYFTVISLSAGVYNPFIYFRF